eukprot:6627600-Pyramimonas_sp.AAC.1
MMWMGYDGDWQARRGAHARVRDPHADAALGAVPTHRRVRPARRSRGLVRRPHNHIALPYYIIMYKY